MQQPLFVIVVALTVLAGNILILFEAIRLLSTAHHSSVLFGFLGSIVEPSCVFPFPGLGGRVWWCLVVFSFSKCWQSQQRRILFPEIWRERTMQQPLFVIV
jgi:hypothetical protein